MSQIFSKRCHKTSNKMNSSQTINLLSAVMEEELYACDSKFFELPTPPSSPRQGDKDGEFDIETIMTAGQFAVDAEDFLFEECATEVLKEVGIRFPELPPDTSLQSILIQDIMWSAPARIDNGQVSLGDGQYRLHNNFCSGPFSSCVAPGDEVFPLETTNIGGAISQTHVQGLGIETPSDSEEEIDFVMEKQLHSTVLPNIKREYHKSNDQSESEPSPSHETKPVTLIIISKPNVFAHGVNKCSTLTQKVSCPTDLHNYSLPVTSLKRVHSYPNSQVTHKSKKFKRNISIPSNLKKVAQKLKSSVGSFGHNFSCSEEFCDAGKRTQHNVFERERRTDLKNSFFNLRCSIPELEGHVRVPKVVTLNKASQYIHQLINDNRKQEREMKLLKMKKENLRKQLAELKQ